MLNFHASVLAHEIDQMSWSAKWTLTDSDFGGVDLTQRGN